MSVSGRASPHEAPGGPGRHASHRLDRQAVLGAASALIERDGLAALSMRRLGRELDVQAMALYRYVPGRERLIDWVVDLVVDELYADPEVPLVPTGGWRDYLSRLAYGLRRMALAHPHLFPLVATRPPTAPWVRPPLRSLRWIESFLAALSSEGFSDDTAVYAYRAFTGFLLGHLLLEVAAQGVDISPIEGDESTVEQPDDPLAGYPALLRLRPQLSQEDSKEEFDDSLANLMHRLEAAAVGDEHYQQTGAFRHRATNVATGERSAE